MKKLITFILLVSSTMVFAKEYSSSTKVRVTHSEPVYEYKKIHDRPHKRYYKENRYKDNTYRSSSDIGLDTIVGATIGVAIGNQIGKGNGKDVARVVGGLLGATIANNTRDERNNTYNANYASYNDYGYETDYVRHYDEYDNRRYDNYNRTEKVLVGYKNYFYYDHKRHFKFSKRPLKKVRITKTIEY